MLKFLRSQKVGHDLVTEQQQQQKSLFMFNQVECLFLFLGNIYFHFNLLLVCSVYIITSLKQILFGYLSNGIDYNCIK